MSEFIHLHVHSHYSLLDGLPKIDEIIERAKKLNMSSCALTDHGVLYGAVEFYKKAKKEGINPIIGSEIYLAYQNMDQKRPNVDNKNYHLVLLVKNKEGYRNLVKLITKAHLEGFYYKPRVDEELLKKHSRGLIALSACLKGKIPELVIKGRMEEAKKTAKKYQEIFGPGNFYLELQSHPNNPDQGKANKGLVEISKELNIPLVATNDCHYINREDKEAQDILMLINTGADKDDPERLTIKADDFSMRSPKEMAESFKEYPQAIENTKKIAEKCNFNFKLGEIKLPPFKDSQNKNPDEYLEKLCRQGLKEKKGNIKSKKEAEKRLNYELSVIKKTGFSTYFLIVQDFVKWAKSERIVVGPGRGSVGGSLVSYLLGITEINPLKHDLLFERFLNIERISMPDIDLDFADKRRDEVIEYVAQKYGRDKVAQIITFGRMTARAVIRDVGRALKLSYSYCDKIAKMIPLGFNLNQTLDKVKEFRQLYDTDQKAKELIEFSKKLEGCARHASTHACGVVISKNSLDEEVPLQHPTQNDNAIVTQYEMHAIEDLGLLKMDFLGLKNLTIIEDTLKRIYKVQGKNVEIENIPSDDKKTFKLFQQARTTGVFQLESSGMKRYLKKLKPTSFEDIVVMVALYRPGPMQFIPDYIDRKNNKRKIKYLHPKLKPILEDTQGICIFQEQLMEIARELAGFSLSEADVLRKAVGKKIKSLLVIQKEKFINGMIKNKIARETAQKIWEWILPFAQYGFNKSHSVAYATIAYQTAYLKSHYPVEFMSALLTSEKSNIDRIAFLMDECKNMGIEVLPPDINESFRNFSVVPKENRIRFGLLNIKNVGEDITETIIKERKENGKFNSLTDFASRIDSRNFNKKSLESLVRAGAFDDFEERNKILENMEKILAFNRSVRQNKINGQKSLFDNGKESPSIKLTEGGSMSTEEKLIWEKELLGLYISSHPLESVKEIIEKKALPLSKLKENNINYRIRVAGIVSSIKKIITKKGQLMVFMEIEDLTDRKEVVIFPSVLEQYSELIQENKRIFISGRVDNWQDRSKIIAEQIEEIIKK